MNGFFSNGGCGSCDIVLCDLLPLLLILCCCGGGNICGNNCCK